MSWAKESHGAWAQVAAPSRKGWGSSPMLALVCFQCFREKGKKEVKAKLALRRWGERAMMCLEVGRHLLISRHRHRRHLNIHMASGQGRRQLSLAQQQPQAEEQDWWRLISPTARSRSFLSHTKYRSLCLPHRGCSLQSRRFCLLRRHSRLPLLRLPIQKRDETRLRKTPAASRRSRAVGFPRSSACSRGRRRLLLAHVQRNTTTRI